MFNQLNIYPMELTLYGPISCLRGSIGKDSDYYMKVQNGKNILAHKPRPTAKSVAAQHTPMAQARQQRFAQLCRMAHEIMGTQELRSAYEEGFCKQKQYVTLRGYIMHCLSEGVKPCR